MASFCRIRKPFSEGRTDSPSATKAVVTTDSQQNGFFEAALQQIRAAAIQLTRSMQKSMTSISDVFHGVSGSGASASRAIVP
jgi:hypothetical protein